MEPDDSVERIREDLMLATARLDLLAAQGRLRLRASSVHDWAGVEVAVSAFQDRLADARIVLEDVVTAPEAADGIDVPRRA